MHNFFKTLIVHEVGVLNFSINISENFLNLRRTERDMIKIVYWSSCKVLLVLLLLLLLYLNVTLILQLGIRGDKEHTPKLQVCYSFCVASDYDLPVPYNVPISEKFVIIFIIFCSELINQLSDVSLPSVYTDVATHPLPQKGGKLEIQRED